MYKCISIVRDVNKGTLCTIVRIMNNMDLPPV